MTTQQSTRRSTTVLRPDEKSTAADVPGRVRSGIATWLRSPALDFYALIVLGTLLIGIGLVMVLSSSAVLSIAKGESPYAGFIRQARFALIGLPLLIAAACAPPDLYRRAAWPLLLIGILLQSLVHTPLGVGAHGNRNWILVGGQTLQPSELLKLALAVWLAAVLARKRPLLHRTGHLLFPVVPVVIVALGLVLWGKDLGTMMVMGMLVAGSLWVAGVPRRWFLLGGSLGVAGVLAMTVTSPNRMARISAWLHGTCEGGTCDQSQSGLQGLAQGGWWGVGLGESAQKWGRLPAAQDDYIFAVIGEELGLIGTLGVLFLFAVLALVLFRMITRYEDHFVQITVGGVSAWILGQAFVNMMVVTGMLPVLGVPLPFISAGGSALVASMLALGMLLSFARHEPGAKAAIHARMSTVRGSVAVHAGSSGPRRRPRRGLARLFGPRRARPTKGRTAAKSRAASTSRAAAKTRSAAKTRASSSRSSSSSSTRSRRPKARS